MEVNCVPASAEIFSNSYHPNSYIFPNMDWNISRFGKMDEFGWWDLEIISADLGTQFTSIEFKEEFQTSGIYLTLAAP